MGWQCVSSRGALSTLAISLLLATTTAAAPPSDHQTATQTPPPVSTPTTTHVRRQNTIVSPSEDDKKYAPTVTTTYAVMAQTDHEAPTPVAGADPAWSTVPVAAMMGLIMPNPDYDIYTGVEYTFGFIDYGSRYNEYAWGWMRETTPVLLGPGPKSQPIAFNATGGTDVSDVPEGHQMCGALTVWNYDHTYEHKFRYPGWYMLAVNNSYYQPEIRDGKCHDPILYSQAFFATKVFSVKARPTDYHLLSASSVTFWEAVSTETPPPVPAEKQGSDQRQKVAIAVGCTLAIAAIIVWTIFFFCYRHTLFHRREAVALNRMRPEERMQFFAENPTHCLNPARPPRWYQRHSPGQRAAMKGDWEEYRGWDWKRMPLPYPPLYEKKTKRGRKGKKTVRDTVVYTPVIYPGMADGRHNPAEQAVAANLHQYSRQARAEQQAYLENQAQIQAILQQQQQQAEADRQAYLQYLRETESERQEYMEQEAEAAHAEYLRQEAEAERAVLLHQERLRDPEYRAYLRQQQAEAEQQAYLQQQEQMRQMRAAQKTAEAGERRSSYYTASQYTEPVTPAQKIMSTYISQAQAHAAEVIRSQEIAQQQQFAQQPSYDRQPSPLPPPLPPKPPSYSPSPRRSRRR